MNELNEVIKAKDDEIKRLKEELQSAREEADGIKADYEQLNGVEGAGEWVQCECTKPMPEVKEM